MTIDYQRAIEIIENAHKYKMKDIREARKVLDEAVDKAHVYDSLINTKKTAEALKDLANDMGRQARHLRKCGIALTDGINQIEEIKEAGSK